MESAIKEKLQKEDVISKMSWCQVVKYYFDGMSDEDANNFLWNYTCYPFHIETALNQIYESYKKRRKQFK